MKHLEGNRVRWKSFVQIHQRNTSRHNCIFSVSKYLKTKVQEEKQSVRFDPQKTSRIVQQFIN